jgi:predicted nucleic acid-binding protein
MADVCCDTSFLFAAYGSDSHTAKALVALNRVGGSLALSSFNTYELANAFRLAEFRGLLPLGSEVHLAGLYRDIERANVRLLTFDLEAVLVEARRLSALYTCERGYRAFDILHVAAALHLCASEFLSFDAQQRTLALSEGLIVGP